jgi:hypothetical protein
MRKLRKVAAIQDNDHINRKLNFVLGRKLHSTATSSSMKQGIVTTNIWPPENGLSSDYQLSYSPVVRWTKLCLFYCVTVGFLLLFAAAFVDIVFLPTFFERQTYVGLVNRLQVAILTYRYTSRRRNMKVNKSLIGGRRTIQDRGNERYGCEIYGPMRLTYTMGPIRPLIQSVLQVIASQP